MAIWGAAGILAALTLPAAAHFQEILPSADVLPDGGAVTLDLVFTHPMENGPVMNMAPPKLVGMLSGGHVRDLTGELKPYAVQGQRAYELTQTLATPGAAVFFVEPAPYFEPAEGKYIVHYAKVVVDSFASGEGWDQLVGLPAEIRPLTRPTGLWTGNVFTGVVLQDGEPVPFAEVEVEYVNDGKLAPKVAIPNDAFVTQVIRADASGTFTYAIPRAGWWGFAALLEGDKPMKAPDGREVPVEEGALIWVKATDMKAETAEAAR